MHSLRFRSLCCFAVAFLAVSVRSLAIENQVGSANTDPTYLALRHVKVSSQAFQVSNLVLKRDVGTFTLTSGTLCLLEPVNGLVTGAVFKGSGTFEMEIRDANEAHQVKLLTKGREIKEEFETLTLRFADGTAEEIRKSSAAKSANADCSQGALDDMNHQLRTSLRYNLTGRLLQPVFAAAADGFFMAAIRGRQFSDRMYYVIDPMGIPGGLPDMAPEEVIMFTTQDNTHGIWYSSHLQSEVAAKAPPNHDTGYLTPVHFKIETTLANGGALDGSATATVTSRMDGLRVLPFDLFPTLRVRGVFDSSGIALNWIQENKNEDSDYYVILPKALAKGEQFTITTNYGGKDAVSNEGSGNYFPVARANWYPNVRFGAYATYDLILHVPKGNTTAATGTLVSSNTEGGHTTTVWKSEVPLSVAGFNVGQFREQSSKLDKLDVDVRAYANLELPDYIQAAKARVDMLEERGHVGNMATLALKSLDTAAFAKKALAEAQLSMLLYTDYFGPVAYKSLMVTQHTATNYGQAWPGLVYLPLTYFMDTTQRHGLGWDSEPYFRMVEPHEVAHQWWGHTVGWNNYRDQWMGEGFSDFSASLFLEQIRNDRKEYLKFWQDEKRLMLEKNTMGVRAIDAGPLVMGYRLNNSRDGSVTRRLIYPKGAYVLHMLRMLMATSDQSDGRFKAMMHDFTKTYANRPASTEDFKHTVEKYMTPQMDLDHNHTMDWFFDDWVYGTDIPDYKFEAKFTQENGKYIMDFSLTQSNVSDRFRNVLPLYLELADGKLLRIGTLNLVGNKTLSQKVSLGALKTPPARALINYNYDTLCTINGN